MTSATQSPHILCINHAPEILELMRTLLEDEGYRVSTQTVVEHDLDRIVGMAPDLILIDYMWSTSDNEWTYLTMLRMDPRTREIPIVLCTGAVGHAVEMQSHLASIDVEVVFKPFDIENLLEVVQATLARADGGGKPNAADA